MRCAGRRVAGHVLELAQIEIRVQFAIDARQQVQVERGRDARRVVIGGQQVVPPASPGPCPAAGHRRGAGTGGRPAENRCAASGSKLPMVLPRNSTSRVLPGRAPLRHLAQSLQVTGLQRQHRADRGQFLRAVRQRAGRKRRSGNTDARLPAPDLPERGRVLTPLPLPSSATTRLRRQQLGQVARHARCRMRASARVRPYSGRHGDGFEQRRADLVVEIAAGQRLLTGARQPGAHVARELVVERRRGHQDSTSRKVA